jgi:hypothetical protein
MEETELINVTSFDEVMDKNDLWIKELNLVRFDGKCPNCNERISVSLDLTCNLRRGGFVSWCLKLEEKIFG